MAEADRQLWACVDRGIVKASFSASAKAALAGLHRTLPEILACEIWDPVQTRAGNSSPGRTAQGGLLVGCPDTCHAW